MTTVIQSIHVDILSRFETLMRKGRLAHAYLFIGPKDVGKMETASALAKLVNCTAATSAADLDQCVCSSCRKLNSGNHPDMHMTEAEDSGTIKIEQIRYLMSRIQLRPFEAKYKVFIIRDIEKISSDGANALLKTLEEPGPDSLMILTTSVPEANLDTVRSRCHAINFFPLPEAKLAKQLQNDYDVEYFQARFLAGFSEGCSGRAEKLNTSKFLTFKNKAIDEIVFKRDSDAYVKKMLSDKPQTADVLDILMSFYRDLILLKSGMPADMVIHQDRVSDLQTLQAQYAFEELTDIARSIVQARKQLRDNLNVKMAMTLIKELIWVR